ncbi:MAG: PAC2 family-domain-containing protein [Monoraphidium minutum]|nr:MAG: PAC2 family-domain-containing protein [Monoraphidium minutum]
MELHPVGEAPDLRGACVVLPAVAFFNVGELAVDALISTLRLRLAARLGAPDLLPVAGNDAFDHEAGGGLLATALELYSAGLGSKLFVLQQRAPAIPGRQKAFSAGLAAWLVAAGVAEVVVLAGLDAQYRRESQLEGPQARFLTASQLAAAAAAPPPPPGGAAAGGAAPGAEEAAARLAGLALSGREAAAAEAAGALGVAALEPDALARELELHSLLPPWPLLSALAAAPLPALLLGAFASEGDNTADGLGLAAGALRLLAARGAAPAAAGGDAAAGGPQMRTPASWAGLYGRPLEEVM